MGDMLVLFLICTTTITVVTGLVMCAPLRLNFKVATGREPDEVEFYDEDSDCDHDHKD